MTQQYLAGELSLLLARLQATAANQQSARAVALLRREAETWPLAALVSVVVRALELADELCWDSLERRDTAAFTCTAAISAELRNFGICARLLEEC
jgi:hypothetical protein